MCVCVQLLTTLHEVYFTALHVYFFFSSTSSLSISSALFKPFTFPAITPIALTVELNQAGVLIKAVQHILFYLLG